MPTVVIIENVSKLYRLGLIGTDTLRGDLQRLWYNLRGLPDPTLLVGDENALDKTSGNSKKLNEYIWALRDINLKVEQGEVFGIIGKNGAGKSTLLKLLSRVTTPTTGNIKIKGRIASLLEVGTGFHPELTGRENIFLNGAILGMTRAEIRTRFDEIVDFSGVAKYIDTPVKRYSSGMYVRLAFAVAAHLDPEILVVDEVLAVGDAEFQSKAIGKMKNVSQQGGRTVLFVSHNMTAIKSLCNSGLVLSNGVTSFTGSASDAVNHYLQLHVTSTNYIYYDTIQDAPGNENIRLKSLKVSPLNADRLTMDSGIRFSLVFYNFMIGANIDSTFEVITRDDITVFHNGCIITKNKDSKQGYYKVEGFLPPRLLNAGSYKINLIFGENQTHVLFRAEDLIHFDLENTTTGKGKNLQQLPGIIFPDLNWKSEFIENQLYEN